tara:strand:- start:292 stop:1701 length:1410 start_codon:yes stop_codon:yes gene_type:complete
MTPQLQQAIKLLQLNNIELCELVRKEMEENPFLEDELDTSLEENEKLGDSRTENVSEAFESGESMLNESKSDDIENRWDLDINVSPSNHNYDTTDSGSIAEQTVSEKVTLKSFLNQQVKLEFVNLDERIIAEILVDYIDNSGWLKETNENLMNIIGCDEKKLEDIILRMKTFEPTGVFARNLEECLTIQLQEKGLFNEKIKLLIANFELLAKGEIKNLCKICGLTELELTKYIKIIKTLNPKPGTKFTEEQDQILEPDVIVNRKNNEWIVELNNSNLPKITVNEDYVKELERLKSSDNDRKFVTESVNSARWLIKAIEQRNLTTLKISAEIVKQQKLFFEKGVSYLKPMILKDVAKKIGMHESTVSRVTTGKLMLTSRGIIEMKNFFSASINGTSNGEAHSAASVRETLKNLISNEPLNNPFSDEIIVIKLQKHGINLARRTVAKYRELLNIPASSERRKMMKIQSIHI